MPQPLRMVHFTRKDGRADTAIVRPRTESGRLIGSLVRKIRKLRRHNPQLAERLRCGQMYGIGLFNQPRPDASRPYRLASVGCFNEACRLTRQGRYQSARRVLQDARMFRERATKPI